MKSNLKIVGWLSVVLLVCVLFGQGMWLFRIREMKINEFRENINRILIKVVKDYLQNESFHFVQKGRLSYGLDLENQFYWKYNHVENRIPIHPSDDVEKLGNQVIYDCLYESDYVNVEKINELYIKALEKHNISQNPDLIIKERLLEKIIFSSNYNSEITSNLITTPINLGYKYKHQLLASFEIPFIFRALKGVLWVEFLFLLGFIICLVWQWNSIQMTVRSVRVQTMGMAHLEHELKKPLATMISAIGGILSRKKSDIDPRDRIKLGMVKARLIKMADITDTMLTSLKTSVLKIERETVDVKLEMEMVVEMFSVLRKHARVDYRVAERCDYAHLDPTYFNYIVINLVDNAIKYGGDKPVVKIDFFVADASYILTVEDNGMGIAPMDQKHIFKQFYRVKDKRVEKTTGFGLGLTFVQKVVCAYGGEIRLESEVGKGSKFIIILPQN